MKQENSINQIIEEFMVGKTFIYPNQYSIIKTVKILSYDEKTDWYEVKDEKYKRSTPVPSSTVYKVIKFHKDLNIDLFKKLLELYPEYTI